MKKEILDLLRCPVCHDDSDLHLESSNIVREEIITGKLQCLVCRSVFSIEGGVPTLLTPDYSSSVQDSFSSQWKMRAQGILGENRTLYGVSIESRVKELEIVFNQIFSDKSGNRRYLEVGSGSSDYIYSLSKKYPNITFIALDFSDAIRISASSFPDQPNLHFIQGDANHLPFKASTFDAVSALGVLHHTQNTAVAFASTSSMVKPGGVFCIWVYPHVSDLAKYYPEPARKFFKFFYVTRDLVFLKSGHRIPKRILVLLIRLYLLPFIFRGIDTFKTMIFVMFDGLAPEYQHRHTAYEIEQWYLKHNFETPTFYQGTFYSRKKINQQTSTGG